MHFDTLVSVEDLAAHTDDAAWCIVDCRHDLTNPSLGEQGYRSGHIRNAQFLHLDRDLSGAKTGNNGRHPLPDPVVLVTKLERGGVSNSTQVVAYDGSGGMFAVRLWWLLRWLGHRQVAVLDGGLSAWQRAGHALTDQAPSVEAGRFYWRLSETPVDARYIQTHLHEHGLELLDARAADRFRGENETLDPIAGHIPGAINRPFKNNLTADGTFKSAAQLRKEFEELRMPVSMQNVVAYCGSGVTACHNLLALEIAGLPGARLYPGSWSEWCSDPKRPVATGSE